MKDQITLDRINLLHPRLKEDALKIYDEIVAALNGSAICRFAYTLRTFAEQDALYLKDTVSNGEVIGNLMMLHTFKKHSESQLMNYYPYIQITKLTKTALY